MGEEKILFNRENIMDFINFVSREAVDIHIRVSGPFGTMASVEICCDKELKVLKEGEYLVKTKETIPNTIPPVHKYVVES